jgi:hypothetical protein
MHRPWQNKVKCAYLNTAKAKISMPESITQKQLKDFKVFPRHVGVWQGDWMRLDANGQETACFKGLLTKKIVDNQWVQTNINEFADGRSVTQHFVGIVVGDNQIKIESSEQPFCNYTMIGEEHGDHLIIFRIWDNATGVLLAVETINLTDDNTCIRTTQGFTPEGKFRGVMIIQESRVG